MTALDYIGEHELLCQLAEEASELSHAALKLHRALGWMNPTPVPCDKARENLLEEIADVLLCIEELNIDIDNEKIWEIRREKKERWLERLEESHGYGDSH